MRTGKGKPMGRVSGDKGFTLVETLVAMGLLAVLALGATDLIVGVKRSEQNVSNSNDAVLFAAALGQFLNSASCTNGLLNVSFTPSPNPPNPGPISPLSISKFNGYGGSANGITIASNVQLIQNRLQIAPISPTSPFLDGLFIRDKGVAGVSLGGGGTRYIAQIGLNLKTVTNFNTATNTYTWTPLPTRFYEVPITVNGGAITSCNSTPNLADYCTASGGTMSGGICTPGGGAAHSCAFSGTYSTIDCQGVPPTCPAGTINPNTGTASCPAGVTGQVSGVNTQTLSYTPPGKKASPQSYLQTTTYYVCLKCS